MPPAGRVFETPALIKDKKDILSHWLEHFQELLNQDNPVDQSIADQIPQLPIISELDTIPSIKEISAAANNLKNNKALGPDGIPGEILKYGGNLLLRQLYSFISSAWASNVLPTQWKDANMLMIYKKAWLWSQCRKESEVYGRSRIFFHPTPGVQLHQLNTALLS